MKHLLTGEVKLFNLKKDYGEKNDLANMMPEKVAEMDNSLTAYLKEIDSEDIQDVYQARLEELDQFEANAMIKYKGKVARLDPVKNSDKIATLKHALDMEKGRYAQNRLQVENNKKSSHWAGSGTKNIKRRR